MISHNSGLELLKRREASIRDGCQILLFLISTSYDERLLKIYKSFARDVDASVGPACVAFAYMSVPAVCPDWPVLQQEPTSSQRKWSAYHHEMNKAAAAIKESLGLKAHSLPSLLLLEPDLKESVRFLSLRDNRFARELLAKLKSEILRSYERDYSAVRKNDLRMLSVMSRHAGSIYGREKAIQDVLLQSKVVPRLAELLERDMHKLDKAGQHRLRGILAKLRSKPRDLCKLVRFMDVNSFGVTGTGEAVSASTLETIYDKLIEEFIRKPSESAYKECKHVSFPVDCLHEYDEFDAYIEFTSPTPELLQAALDVDDHSGWWEIIRKMVPQGFEL